MNNSKKKIVLHLFLVVTINFIQIQQEKTEAAIPDDWPNYASNPFLITIPEPVKDKQFFVIDLNQDGLLDFTYRSESKLFAIDHFGNLMWQASVENPDGKNGGTRHAAADIDGDNVIEILALDGSNQILVFNGLNGQIEQTISLPIIGPNNQWFHIAVVNLRGRGDRDVILQTLDILETETKTVSFYVNRNLLAWDMENNQEIWRVVYDYNESNGIYDGYWGPAHGSFQAADVDGDGLDEVVGGNMIDHDGTILDLGYPTNWVGIKSGGFVDHLDCVSIGDFRPDLPGLEWIVTEEDHQGKTDWHTTMLSANGIIWRKETQLFSGKGKEPQNVAAGNFDSNRSFSEVWVRSRFDGPTDSQYPWIFDAFGNEFQDYDMQDVLSAGFNTHENGNSEGVEMISTIDWEGGEKHYFAAKARHIDGNIGVFDALTGDAIWHTPEDFPATNATLIYTADIAGDSREEVIIYDTSGKIQIYWNQAENLNQPESRKWNDPLYKRFKQNWNYYSPAGYINKPPRKAQLTVAENGGGQATDALDISGSVTSAQLFRLSLTASVEVVNMGSSLTLGISSSGVDSGDFANLQLIEDTNNNGVIDPGENQVGTLENPLNIDDGITFSDFFVPVGTIGYIFTADLNNLAEGDELTVSLPAGKITNVTGATSGVKISATGTASSVTHIEDEVSNLIFSVERSSGNVFSKGSFIPSGADLAEYIHVSEPVEPGDIVELDPSKPKQYRKARAYSPFVSSVITTEPGFTLGNNQEKLEPNVALAGETTLNPWILNRSLLALVGQVPVKATTQNGRIFVGDLLTVSGKPGYAMRCSEAKFCEGQMIGKALEGLENGEGKILVLLMSR